MMKILTALFALGMIIGADAAADAKLVTAWFLTVPGDNPNLPGHVREISGTIFSSRAKCQAKIEQSKKIHPGERFACMKIQAPKEAVE
jgi:hypothetical protein